MKIQILILASLLTACASEPPESEVEKAQPTLVEKRRASLKSAKAPVKGRFLDYIYKIQPDHKLEGYSISTKELNNGYAYGMGPYDGWFMEFFLFRGKDEDLVFRQTSGYEVPDEKKTYGFGLEAHKFKGGQKQEVQLRTVLPLAQIDKLFDSQIKKLKAQEKYKRNWAHYYLIKLPIKGTKVELKSCKLEPSPPFATDTPCVGIGSLKWNGQNFVLEPSTEFALSTETI